MGRSDISIALEAIGFNEKETALYVTLLELGEASAYLISKISGIKRPTTYLLLDALRKKGAVLLVPRQKSRLYIAQDPEILFEQANERIQRAKRVLPELQQIRKQDSNKIQVLYYEGFDGVQEAMRYGMADMEKREMLAFWADVTEETDQRFNHFKDWHELFRLNQISLRGFIPQGDIHDKYRKLDRIYRRRMQVMPKSLYNPLTFFDIGDTFVRFFDPTHMQAIVVENPSVANVLRQIFELVWKGGYGKINE